MTAYRLLAGAFASFVFTHVTFAANAADATSSPAMPVVHALDPAGNTPLHLAALREDA